MKSTHSKYLAIVLLIIYQVNVSHHIFTLIGHELVHLVEDHIHHEHHHHHSHESDHQADHEHHILYTFDASFEDHSDQESENADKSALVRINIDKHLLSKLFYKGIVSLIRPKQPSISPPQLLKIFVDIPTPPPQQA